MRRVLTGLLIGWLGVVVVGCKPEPTTTPADVNNPPPKPGVGGPPPKPGK
jgi:hypothetical protein